MRLIDMSARESELLRRIEQLERQIAELQSRPVYVPMPYPVPMPAPPPPTIPYYPQPWLPQPLWVGPDVGTMPRVIC